MRATSADLMPVKQKIHTPSFTFSLSLSLTYAAHPLQTCLSRPPHSKFASPDEARDTFKYLKNEGIGKTFRFFYSAWVAFEDQQGNTSKSRELIRRARHCDRPTEALVEQEDGFKLFMHQENKCARCQRQRTASASTPAAPFGITPAKKFKLDASKLFSTAKKTRGRHRSLEPSRLGKVFGRGVVRRRMRSLISLVFCTTTSSQLIFLHYILIQYLQVRPSEPMAPPTSRTPTNFRAPQPQRSTPSWAMAAFL